MKEHLEPLTAPQRLHVDPILCSPDVLRAQLFLSGLCKFSVLLWMLFTKHQKLLPEISPHVAGMLTADAVRHHLLWMLRHQQQSHRLRCIIYIVGLKEAPAARLAEMTAGAASSRYGPSFLFGQSPKTMFCFLGY